GLGALVYRLRPGGRVLVIGAGAGLDVASAGLLSAREVTAVEVNPAIARDVMSREPFLGYSARLHDRPGVGAGGRGRRAGAGGGAARAAAGGGVWAGEPFLGYSGRLYERPGVRLVVDE